MSAPLITKVTGVGREHMECCRPLDTTEAKQLFKDRWLKANPDLTESDICQIQAKGLEVKSGWVEHFKKKEVDRVSSNQPSV